MHHLRFVTSSLSVPPPSQKLAISRAQTGHQMFFGFFFPKLRSLLLISFFLMYKCWVSFRFSYYLSEYYWSLTVDDFCTSNFFHSGLKKVEATSFAPFLLQLPKFLVNPLLYYTHTQKIWQSQGGVSLEVKKNQMKREMQSENYFFGTVSLLSRHINLGTY